MIYIQKGREPASLTRYRQQDGAYFDGYDHKEELREVLLRDQGYICAYCMRRIYNDPMKMKIEHWVAQSRLASDKDALDYRILLGVCDGCRGDAEKNTTCDEHRGDQELYVNPLDSEMMETVFYKRDGSIHSKDPRIEHDLEVTLNLNCKTAKSRIVLNRKKIYEECMDRLIRLQKKGNWKEDTIKSVLRYYNEETEGRKKEYVGVPLYILKKRAASISK